MDSARVVRAFEQNEGAISLMAGSPGPDTLEGCKDILLKATSFMLDEDTDHTATFRYGPDMGDLEYRQQLANFLSQQYGDTVDSDQLMVTAGATQALHMVATLLFNSGTVVFTEDPTYFAACSMLKKDFQMELVPVPCDDEGIDTDTLDRLLTAHRPKSDVNRPKPFWAMVYTIPVYNNPTGRCYSAGRCRRLVELARKHDVLLLAEDVYNLIHFGDSHPPPRLLSYDRPSDADYKGHTLSSGSFSKILAPGLRLGWLEGPVRILDRLHGSYLSWSGGSPNHYASRLAATALKLGLQSAHLQHVREIYKARRDVVCKILRDNLPKEASFLEPQGGFFVWVEFPEGTDTFEMVKWLMNKYSVFFLPGVCASVEGKHNNCARLSFCYLREKALVEAVTTVCKGAKEFLAQ
ncbi:2-aminoadipate transaminase-like [Babylonia areolata]|uniref:2-aminoadipate transaminase-like n=1 Tax=Babylonia areolata TaxID=304850 RepID=UPI003FD395F0